MPLYNILYDGFTLKYKYNWHRNNSLVFMFQNWWTSGRKWNIRSNLLNDYKFTRQRIIRLGDYFFEFNDNLVYAISRDQFYKYTNGNTATLAFYYKAQLNQTRDKFPHKHISYTITDYILKNERYEIRPENFKRILKDSICGIRYNFGEET